MRVVDDDQSARSQHLERPERTVIPIGAIHEHHVDGPPAQGRLRRSGHFLSVRIDAQILDCIAPCVPQLVCDLSMPFFVMLNADQRAYPIGEPKRAPTRSEFDE